MTLLNTANTPTAVDPDERAVEEVHCIECGVPISAIPSWYAVVNVKFICEACRSKSPKLAALAPADIEAPRAAAEGEGEAEPALDEIDVDDIEIEDVDLEPEAGEAEE